MKIVKIEWIDSYGCGASWGEFDDMKDITHTCVSIGYLALDGENVKVIVPHHSPENKEIDAREMGCGDMTIPTVSIIKITELKEVE